MDKTINYGDLVLVRNNEADMWEIELFDHINEDSTFLCSGKNWKYCIPIEGNEHLLQATKVVREEFNLFGITLEPGYVIKFDSGKHGVIFPTSYGLAIIYTCGSWRTLSDLDKDSIVAILGPAKNQYIDSGDKLWEKWTSEF